MKAVILTAGLGTRLSPITTIIPKPLIPVVNRPLIDILVEYLKSHGFSHFGINLYHLSGKIRKYLDGKGDHEEYWYSFEPVILNTGGGIAQFADFLRGEELFLVHNCDVVSNLDISRALAFHRLHGGLATLILIDNAPTNVVKVLSDGRIIDIRGRLGSYSSDARMLTFSGIAIYDTRIVFRMPRGSIFSIIDFLLDIIRSGDDRIMGYLPDGIDPLYWKDVGNVSSYLELHRDILIRRVFTPAGVKIPSNGLVIADDAKVSEDVTLDGFVVIGSRACIEKDVHLKDALVFPCTSIPSGVHATNVIFADNIMVGLQNENHE